MTRTAEHAGAPRWRRPMGIASIAALTVAIAGAVIDVRQAAATFLVAYLAAVSVVLGVLAMIMIAHLTTATWFAVLRRRADRVLDALPVLAALGVLVLLALPVVYAWVGTRPPAGVDEYLNVPFFIARFILYWVAWLAIARALRATARIERQGDVVRAARRYRRISAVGLVVLGTTMTLAAFDWMMSLTPEWYSTIYGVYWFAGGMVGGLALLAAIASAPAVDNALPTVTPDHFQSLATLLLTFILFWLYIGYSQYIVIWSAGLPREVTWYALRTRGGWAIVAGVLLIGNFVFPFLVLLVRAAKRSRFMILALALALLAGHVLDTFWIVIPGLVPVTWWTVLLAAAMLIVVSTTAVAFGVRYSPLADSARRGSRRG